MATTSFDVTTSLDTAIAAARRRLVPFLLLMYILAFLDRANIGFAKQAFETDTGVDAAAYALGAGLFFVSYALLEVPSNLIMHRVGARWWLARIMVTWGIVSAATMFVRGPQSFYLLRLLLGAAEAGFFPGVILYLTYWFPDRARGQMLGLFYFGAPLAFILGSPLCGFLLTAFDGVGGFAGWQWMFLVEGGLATLVGIWAIWYLDDKPAQARWLTPDQRGTLSTAIAREQSSRAALGPSSLAASLAQGRVLLLVAIYFLIQMSVYGVIFYLPTQVAALLGTKIGLRVGLVSAIPWLCALAAAFYLPRLADRTGQYRVIAAITLAVSGLGIALSGSGAPALLALIGLCFAAAGFIAVQPLFWTFPTRLLSGVPAAGGIALINAVGALGGFVAPNVEHWADTSLGSAHAGSYVLAGTTLLGAVLIAAMREPAAMRS